MKTWLRQRWFCWACHRLLWLRYVDEWCGRFCYDCADVMWGTPDEGWDYWYEKGGG